MTNSRVWTLPAVLCVAFLFVSVAYGAEAQKAEFNSRYAPPFGFRPNIRVENNARFSYFTNQGEVAGHDAEEHGGFFSLMLAKENSFGLAITSKWTNGVQEVTELDGTCTPALTGSKECLTEKEKYVRNKIELGFVPTYRVPIDVDWFWMNIITEAIVHLHTGRLKETRAFEIDPGVQFYFDAADWFGFELDAQALFFVTDPDEPEYFPGYVYAPQDEEMFVPGFYTLANFLFKIGTHHYLNLQVEETMWFHDSTAADDKVAEDYLNFTIDPIKNGLTEDERLDIRFRAKNNLSVGGGYQIRYGILNAGVGAKYHGLTDADYRHTFSIYTDFRFTF